MSDIDVQEAYAAINSVLPEPGTFNFLTKHTKKERIPVALDMLRLRVKEGWTLERIAEHWGCTHPTVSNYLQLALSTYQEPIVDEARKAMVMRVERMIEVYTPLAAGGDAKAADVLGKYMDRLNKLLGLEKPIQVEQTITEVTAQERELQQMIAEAERQEKLKEAALRESINGNAE